MASARTLFRRNVAKVKADARKASAELVQRLKDMSPTEFLRQPPSVFNRLTLAQYREIVRVIDPNVKLPNPKIEFPIGENRSLRDWWREQSVRARSAALMAILTVVFAVVGVLTPWIWRLRLSQMDVVRPISTLTWPTCSRLSAYTDGCVYTPTQDLDWDQVARQLDMPVEILRRNNRHLPPQFIVRGAPLVIWRERGRLEN